MSIIIHGPQGCGKSLYAQELRAFYKMDVVHDDIYNPYPKNKDEFEQFKEGKTLFLTHLGPDESPYHVTSEQDRRVMSFNLAMAAMAIDRAKAKK